MMAGNPNWWSTFSSQSNHPCELSDDTPAARSQLLVGGSAVNEEASKFGGGLFQQHRKLQENLYLNQSFVVDYKQAFDFEYDQFQPNGSSQPSINVNSSWPHQLMPAACTANWSHSLLNFSGEKPVEQKNHLHNQEHSSVCNSSGNGGVPKKARVHQSSPQPALKVRKEKLGERITALHQIVSPFGKTDTASVLSEAIRHIRFLQAQIEAVSAPYMRNSSAQHSVSESTRASFSFAFSNVLERNSFFHEEHGQDSNGDPRVLGKDLRSRGLCLVPISYTQHVVNDINGVDYWAPPPALGGGF